MTRSRTFMTVSKDAWASLGFAFCLAVTAHGCEFRDAGDDCGCYFRCRRHTRFIFTWSSVKATLFAATLSFWHILSTTLNLKSFVFVVFSFGYNHLIATDLNLCIWLLWVLERISNTHNCCCCGACNTIDYYTGIVDPSSMLVFHRLSRMLLSRYSTTFAFATLY